MKARAVWQTDEVGLRAENDRVASIVGRRLEGGRYVELDYATAEPAWDGPGYHSLDYGLELDLDDGSTWSFVWKMNGEAECLAAVDGRLVDLELTADAAAEEWPLVDVVEWRPLLGRTVSSVGSAWNRVGPGLCPVTWCLSFSVDEAVAITLGERGHPDGEFYGTANNVAVFFDLNAAAAVGASLPEVLGAGQLRD